MARPLIVAIDGPAGAGKSSVSKVLARRLDFELVDTGAIYRCVALKAMREGVAFDDDAGLGRLLDGLELHFHVEGEVNHVFMGHEDVSTQIRTPEVSMGASAVSSRGVVRERLLGLQRRLALQAKHGAILEGRDIGTVVFPDAEVKVFLEASSEVRARRRYEELFAKGVETPLEAVLADQTKRDRDDAARELAPLKPAPDAIRLDSTSMPFSDVVRRIEQLVERAYRRRVVSQP